MVTVGLVAMNGSELLGCAYDYIIVGGGSSGCVLASRLSEDSRNRVLLIEAGPDLSHERELPSIADPGLRTVFKSELFWGNLPAQATPASAHAAERNVLLFQAKLLGGGSSINGMHAQRGFPSDYEEWKALGVTGWGWDDVLPFFIKLERDQDFSGPLHGNAGPIPISRMKRDRWGPISAAVEKKLISDGLPAQDDLNSAVTGGVGPVPLNISPATRVSAAMGYLTPQVRSRSNLAILTGAEVGRVVFESNQAVGVELRGSDPPHRIAGREVILSCGAILSPALLQRSGIGPGAALHDMGIAVRADRVGVGRNLRNHAMLGMKVHLRRAARRKTTDAPPCMMVARYSSGLEGCPSHDMILNLWERVTSPHVHDPLGAQIADFMFLLNKPFSSGHVSLHPNGAAGSPRVRLNMLHDPRDLQRMVGAFRRGMEILSSSELKAMVNLRFLLKPSPLLFAYLRDDAKGRLLSRIGAAMIGTFDRVGAALLRKWTTPLDSPPSEDVAVAKLVQASVTPSHPGGTCRLGHRDDPAAVVDATGRVIGVDGLRVADASIFPTLMSAGPNLPIMMAAEKIASHILRHDR